jgi:ABC-type multidrug transport system permease subunit
MTALAHMGPHAVSAKRPGAVALVIDQIGYAVREQWRSRLVLIFTFILPLVWLVMIGLLAGNEAVDEVTGVRVMQFVTPTAAVMGVLFAAYPPVANSLGLAREQKITKRLRGTPLPTWAYLLGRVGAAVILATAAVVVMLGIGVVAYEVQIQWQTAPATVVTLVVGVGCFAALGLAVGAVAPSASVAQSFSIASAVVVTFLSGLFTIGTVLPAWMETIGSIFPVRHLLTTLQDQFNPFLSGSGWNLQALAVMAAWGAAGVVVAAWALRREPRAAAAPVAVRPVGGARQGLSASQPGRPGGLAVLFDQTQWANTGAWRDAGWVFFAVVMPVGLYALMSSMYGNVGFRPNDMPMVFFFACGMAAYGAGVTAFVNMPEAVATARDRGVLKRLRGTPLATWQYLAGRTASVLWIALLTAALVFAVAILVFGATVSIEGVPLGIAVVVLGTLTIAACGYALAAVAPSGRAMGVISLSILLPLSFFSDIFVIGDAPEWMGTVGSIFPLRHFVHALAASLDPEGVSVPWENLAVMAVWLVGASLVALRWFRWEPKR